MTDSERRAVAAEQLVEHVDPDGGVIEIVSRAEMRARSLRHRSVYIAVVDSNNQLLVHKRADWKDVFPGAWDLAFGGVCDVGESWHDSAQRELREEAGISGELIDHGSVNFDAPGVSLVGRLYHCRHDGPFSFDDGEVTDARWVPLSELESFLANNVVPPDSAQIITVESLTATPPPSDAAAIAQLESRDARQPLEEPPVTTDLTTASVRPSGREGTAARTAAGFVALGSPDAAALFSWIDENQHSTDLIEGLATEITALAPSAFSMLFTAGGEPWLLAWGAASTLIDGSSARFVISPTDNNLLVHELGASASEAQIVMSTGPVGEDLPASPIELSEGSVPADAVTIALGSGADDGSLIVPLVSRHSDEAPEPAVAVSPLEPAPIAPAMVAPPEFSESAIAENSDDAVTTFDADEVESDSTDVPTGTTPAVESDPSLEVVIDAGDGPPPIAPAFVSASPAAPSAPAMPSVPPEFAPPEQSSPFSAHLPPTEEPADPTPAQPPALGLLPTPAGPVMVLGVACPQGHHNHPDAVYCSQCGTKMGVHQTTVLVNGIRPPLGVLVVDDGTTFSIDQDLVLGRDAPSHADVRAGTASAMMLSDDSLALSRHHARIRLDDWSVFVTDLNSSNGTWFSRGSTGSWNRVAPDQSVALEAGDRLRVGGRVVQVELHHVR